MTGKPPLNLEARAFMEQTLLLHLVTAAAARNAEYADKQLDQTLRRVWAKPGSLSEKQAQIFARCVAHDRATEHLLVHA